ncbi:MAG: exonuclease domain-containing protein [bacterium]|nr:exonuclease domain-containing protein [bacterium]
MIFEKNLKNEFPFEKCSFVALDIEATGLKIKEDRILEIALVKWEYNGKKQYFETLFNPGIEPTQHSISVHGITKEEFQNAPEFRKFKEKIVEFIGDSILIGFNILSLDLSLLNKELRLQGENPLYNYVIDVQGVATKILGTPREKSLYFVSKELDISTTILHRALPDAETTLKIWIKLLEHFRIHGFKTLKELHERGYFNIKLNPVAREIFLLGRQNRYVEIVYKSPTSPKTKRTIEPLGVRGSMVDAFCNLRLDFRSFNTYYILSYK